MAAAEQGQGMAWQQRGAQLARHIIAQRRWRWGTYGLAAFFVLLGLLGFLFLPPLLKDLAEEKLEQALKRPVRVERVEINPYLLALNVRGLSVQGAAA